MKDFYKFAAVLEAIMFLLTLVVCFTTIAESNVLGFVVSTAAVLFDIALIRFTLTDWNPLSRFFE